jgi:hypothetical protein
MAITDCKYTPDLDSLQKKGLITPEEADDIKKRMANLDAMLSAAQAQVPRQLEPLAHELRVEAISTVTEVHDLVKAINTRSITDVSGMRNWLGVQFGGLFQTGLFDLGGKLTPEEALSQAARQGRGRVSNILTDLALVDELSRAQKKLRPLKKAYGFTDDAFDRFLRDAYEVGFHPQLQTGYGVGPRGLEVLRQRQLAFTDWMDEVGLSAADRQLLESAITEVSANFDRALELSRRLNINVGNSAELQRYMPRFFTKETDVRIGWKSEGPTVEWTSAAGQRTRSDFSNAFTNSRRSNVYVVEDEVVFDAVLRSYDANIYDKLGVESVRDLMGDGNKLVEAFFFRNADGDRLIPDEALNVLVENNLISKLDMTTNELFDYMKVNYELPFEELNELIVTDWRKAGEIYRKQLEELAGNSMLTQAIATAAKEEGWGVDRATKLANPEEYSKYVPLLPGDGPNSAIPQRIADRFSITASEYGQVYVHPAAARLYRGMMDLTTDPNSMGALGNVFEVFNTAFNRLGFKELMRTFRTQALTSTRFVFGQLYGAVLQLWAGGGDLAAFGTDIIRTMTTTYQSLTTGRSFNELLLSKLDDSRRLYRVPGNDELLTERELWKWGRGVGVINEYVIPWSRVVEDAPPGTLTDRGIRGWAERNARYIHEIAKSDASIIDKVQRGLGQTWRATGAPIDEATGNMVGMFAEVFDNTARLNLLRAVTLTTDRSVPGVTWREARRFLTTQDLSRIQTNPRELYRYMQSYFYSYDNVGLADKQISRNVIPFWGFLSRNMVGQTRMLIRRPSRFANWNRIIAALNQSQVTEDDDLPVAAIPQYVFGERSGVYWKRQNDLGEDEYVMFSARGWDSINEGLNPQAGMVDTLLRRMGVWGPSSQIAYTHPSERLQQLPWSEDDDRSQIVRQAFDTLYPQWSLPFAAVSGDDPATGFSLSGSQEYLGVNMPTWLVYTLRNVAPITNQLNTANPGGWFGRAARVDYETGEVIDNGELSWAGVERNHRRVVSDYRTFMERVYAAARLNPERIDVAKNSGDTETDMYFSLQAGEEYIKKRAQAIVTDRGLVGNPARLEQQVNQLKMEAMQLAYLDMEYRALQKWRERRGYLPPQAVRTNSRQNAFDFINQELTEAEQYESIDRYVIETLNEVTNNVR